MDKRKRNWIVFFVILALLIGRITYKKITNSDAYLEWKSQRVREDIIEFITEDDSQWQSVAEAARKEAQTRENKTLYKSEYQTEFPTELDGQLNRMIANCPVKFDGVLVGTGVPLSHYPEDCCVFRYTIEFDRGVHDYQQGVYAWVDLVYAPDCDWQTHRAFSEPGAHITGDWYVIRYYGY